MVALTLALAGCGSTTTIIESTPAPRAEWPQAGREAFMQSCHAGKGSQANCECLLHHEEARTNVNDVLTKDTQFREALKLSARECAGAATAEAG